MLRFSKLQSRGSPRPLGNMLHAPRGPNPTDKPVERNIAMRSGPPLGGPQMAAGVGGISKEEKRRREARCRPDHALIFISVQLLAGRNRSFPRE